MPSKDVIFKGKIYWQDDITTPPDPTPPSSNTITIDDFEFLGSYKLDRDNAGLFTFAYGGIAGRKVNGKTRLFLAINEITWHGAILEFELPDAAPSLDWTKSPDLIRKRWWGDIYGGRRGTYMTVSSAEESVKALEKLKKDEVNPDIINQLLLKIAHLKAWITAHKTKSGKETWEWYEFPVGMSMLGTLLWDEATKRLFWTYYDSYNVSGRPDWGLGASELNDNSVESAPDSFTADGPWRFSCTVEDNWIAYGPWRGLGLCIRPDTGELITSGSIMSGNAGSPWGCDGYGGGRLPVKGAPVNIDLVQPVKYLEHYYMGGKIDINGRVYEGEPLRAQRRRIDKPVWERASEGQIVLNINNEIYGYDSWRETDGGGLALWINNINGKSGLIYFGNSCVAHEWYSTAGNNFACPSHQIPSPVMITGPVSTENNAMMWIYKVADVQKVVSGELKDYEPEPEEVNLTKTFNVHGSPANVMGGNNGIGGTYFDKEERKLYLISTKADNMTAAPEMGPLIQVFRVGGN